ncbi:MAG: hypothetical protein R2873_03130 [Caldilineaceae bacterium]|nr:hypothetical protein [Caldilineaceae bacterium]
MNADPPAPNRTLGLWVLLILSVFAWAPAAYPGYWLNLQGFAAAFNSRYVAPIAQIGVVADVWRGAGSAAFLLTNPLIQLGLSPTTSVRVMFMLAVVIGGVGIYLWLQPRFGDRAAGLAGLLYTLAPPLLTTIYVRGNLADAVVLALLPAVLTGATLYRSTRSPATIGLAVVALLWIWRAQAGLAVWITLILLLYVLVVERDQLAAIAVFVTGAAGVLSLIPIWSTQGPPVAVFAAYFLDGYQILAGGGNSAQPFTLGFALSAFGVVAAWLLWRRRAGGEADLQTPLALRREQDRLLIFAAVALVVGVLLTLRIAAPLWTFARAERLLTYPGQILLVVLPFAAALAGSLPALLPVLQRRGYWAVLVAVPVLAAAPYLTPTYTQFPAPDAPTAVFGARADIVLLTAKVTEESVDDGGRAVLDVAWQPLQPITFDYNVFFQALRANAAADGYDVVGQLDSQPLPDRPATQWRPGEIFTATYTLDLSADPSGAALRYYFGFYDWRDGSRLPITSGDDKVILYGE